MYVSKKYRKKDHRYGDKTINNMITFNLSNQEFSHAILGWCKYLIRPYIKPYTMLKIFDDFLISGEENKYICRVDNIQLFDNINETITHENCNKVWFDSAILSLERVRYLASLQIFNKRYKDYYKVHGIHPKIALIKYSLHKDPRN